jgi:hypothetical protein
MFFVDDADVHGEHARCRAALDPEGHMWWITQRVRNSPGR